MTHRRIRKNDERGAVLVLSVVGLVLAMIAGGLAVDLGFIAQHAREDQKVADLAALDGVRALPADPTTAARDSACLALRNDFPCLEPGYSVVVEWADAVTGLFSTNTLLLPLANAVRVTTTSPHENAFPFLGAGRSVTRKAVATLGNGSGCNLPNLCVVNDGSPIGTVRVGSTVATIDSAQSAIFNKLLNQVLGGGSFNLNAVGWQGIAAGNVNFSKLKAALNYQAGTVDSLGSATFTFRQLLDASVSAMSQSGESAANINAANQLLTIAGQVGASAGAVIQFDRFFDVVGNVGSGVDVADAEINALDIVRAGLALADSDHFAELTLLASDLPAPITDLVDVKVKFGLIEAPQMKSGPPKLPPSTYRTVATTSQVRLLVEVKLNLDLGLVARVNVTIPYLIDAGTAQGKLDTLNCVVGNSVPTSVVIVGVTQPASVSIGTTTNPLLSGAAAPSPGVATLADVSVTPLTKVRIRTTAATTVSVTGKTQTLTFTPPYSMDNPQTMTGTQLLSLPVLAGATTDTQVLVSVLGVDVLDVGLSTSVEAALLNAVVGRSTAILNNVITPTMKALGLSLGGATIWAPPPQNCNPTSFNVDPGPGGTTAITVPTLSS